MPFWLIIFCISRQIKQLHNFQTCFLHKKKQDKSYRIDKVDSGWCLYVHIITTLLKIMQTDRRTSSEWDTELFESVQLCLWSSEDARRHQPEAPTHGSEPSSHSSSPLKRYTDVQGQSTLAVITNARTTDRVSRLNTLHHCDNSFCTQMQLNTMSSICTPTSIHRSQVNYDVNPDMQSPANTATYHDILKKLSVTQHCFICHMLAVKTDEKRLTCFGMLSWRDCRPDGCCNNTIPHHSTSKLFYIK